MYGASQMMVNSAILVIYIIIFRTKSDFIVRVKMVIHATKIMVLTALVKLDIYVLQQTMLIFDWWVTVRQMITWVVYKIMDNIVMQI